MNGIFVMEILVAGAMWDIFDGQPESPFLCSWRIVLESIR
jgi:hypothetical protein